MRRHSTDAVALLAGALFITVGAAYLGAAVRDSQIEARWVLPTVLIALGFAGLVVSLVNLAKQRRSAEVAAQPFVSGAPLPGQDADITATMPLQTAHVETTPVQTVPAEMAELDTTERETVGLPTERETVEPDPTKPDPTEQETVEPRTESPQAEPPQTLPPDTSLLEKTSPVEADGEAGDQRRDRS